MTLKYAIWYLVQPSSWTFWLAAGALLLLWCRGDVRRARLLLAAAIVFPVLFAWAPGWWFVTHPLESVAERAQELPDNAGILILGGAVDLASSRVLGEMSINENAERITEGARLAHRLPNAPLLYAAGQFVREDPQVGERLRHLLDDLTAGGSRVIVDQSSIDTCDNLAVARQVRTRLGLHGPWILVTSAWHMPRALLCAEAQGLHVIAWPVDRRTAPALRGQWIATNPWRAMLTLDQATHEWLGILHYRLSGRTRALWPENTGVNVVTPDISADP